MLINQIGSDKVLNVYTYQRNTQRNLKLVPISKKDHYDVKKKKEEEEYSYC